MQPWRDSHLCALCARGNRSTKRRCSRCRQVGHRIETCVEPPADWLALGDQRIEPLPCCEPLSEAVRAEFERERAMARAEFDALTEQLSALQARVKRERARVEQLTRALAGEAIRDIAVEARAELERGVVVVVRLDTGEVVRERSMTEAERAANSPRFKRIERPGSPSSSGQIEAA